MPVLRNLLDIFKLFCLVVMKLRDNNRYEKIG